jgi:hypothetical protein
MIEGYTLDALGPSMTPHTDAKAMLSNPEIRKASGIFYSLDRDRNGVLRREEFAAVHGGDEDGFFAAVDADGVCVCSWRLPCILHVFRAKTRWNSSLPLILYPFCCLLEFIAA